MNLCSVVVYSKPKNSKFVKKELEKYKGVEVHGGVEEGKIIVTLEEESDNILADTINKFNDIKGVINTVMVYHVNEV